MSIETSRILLLIVMGILLLGAMGVGLIVLIMQVTFAVNLSDRLWRILDGLADHFKR